MILIGYLICSGADRVGEENHAGGQGLVHHCRGGGEDGGNHGHGINELSDVAGY